jgi:hypothetical protein
VEQTDYVHKTIANLLGTPCEGGHEKLNPGSAAMRHDFPLLWQRLIMPKMAEVRRRAVAQSQRLETVWFAAAGRNARHNGISSA